MTPSEHWEAQDAKWLDPEQELEIIEVGDRVSMFILGERLCRIYSPPVFDLSVFQPYGSRHSLDPWAPANNSSVHVKLAAPTPLERGAE